MSIAQLGPIPQGMESDTIQLSLPKPHAAQATVLSEAERFNVVCCGRRWGKTTLGINRVIKPALYGKPTAWFAPTYKYLSDVWDELAFRLGPITATLSQQKRRIQLITGGHIDVWNLGDTVRGRAYSCIVVDEAAIEPTLMRIWQRVLRPALTDYKGEAWFLSTPRGMNDFHTLWNFGKASKRRHWASWQMPSLKNPHIPADEVEAAREDLTEMAYGQEYLAQFVSWEGAVFRRILDAVSSVEQAKKPDDRYVIGVDWAKSRDYTVFTCISQQTREVVDWDRFTNVAYSLQRARLQAMYERWKPDVIIAEANAMGDPIIEQLRNDGLPVRAWTTTNASKAEAVEALALAFEQNTIRIPDNPVLIGELQAFEGKKLPSGLLRYEAPEGLHDDCVISLALAWQGVAGRRYRQPLAVAAVPILKSDRAM